MWTILVIPLLLARSEDPEGIYRRMEDKVLAAKTILIRSRVGFEGDLRGESRAVLRLDRQARRFRYDRSMIEGRMDRDVQVIADGARIKASGPYESAHAIPESFGSEAARVFLYYGLYEGAERMSRVSDGNWVEPQLLDFKFIGRERIGDRSAACISFTRSVTMNGPSAWGTWKRDILLWIDEASFLPVRRVERQGGKCIHWTTTETFEEVRFNAEFPADRFKLPD